MVLLYGSSLATQSMASQSIFSTQDNTLTLKCLRLKQNGQIGDDCYDVSLQLINDSYFDLLSLSAPSSATYESSDPIFDVDTLQVDIPNVLVGSKAYSVNLIYDPANQLLSINSVNALQTETPVATTSGICDLQNSPLFNEMLKTGACLAYGANIDASRAENACESFGGIWRPNSACPTGYLDACALTDTINNISYVQYTYDKGIVDMYKLLGSGGPTRLADMLIDSCDSQGGISLTMIDDADQ